MEQTRIPIRLDNPRVWRTYLGGDRLDAFHGVTPGKVDHFPEEWILSLVSAHNVGREQIENEGMSRLFDSEATLLSWVAGDPEATMGKAFYAEHGLDFGVLIKLIDSAERLTLQAHPDRETAMRLFNSPYGKTECWHILETREVDGQQPCIYYGFKEYVTRELWKELFDKQDIPGMLAAMHRFEVQPGDTILIEGGMPHAIGPGCFLVEIQEPTDLTIRVERTTPSGFQIADDMCHQGVGFEKMFDVFHYTPISKEEVRRRWFIPPQTDEVPGGTITELVGYGQTPFFKMEKLVIDGELTLHSNDVFSGLYVLDGSGMIEANGVSQPIEKGAQLFLPAAAREVTLRADASKTITVLRFYSTDQPTALPDEDAVPRTENRQKYVETLEGAFHVAYKDSPGTSNKRYHVHRQYELLLCLSDNMFVDMGEHRPRDISADTLLIFNHMDLHLFGTKEEGAPNLRYVIYFDPNYVDYLSSSYVNLLDCFLFRTGEDSNILKLTPDQSKSLRQCFDKILSVQAMPEAECYGKDLHLQLLTAQLLLEVNTIYHNKHGISNLPETKDRQLVYKVIEHIKEHSNDNLSLDELSKIIFVNKYSLCKLFQNLVGISHNQYLIGCRIRKAKEMLLAGQSVEAVCRDTGFRTPSHFSAIFKSKVGQTPKQFQKYMQQTNSKPE